MPLRLLIGSAVFCVSLVLALAVWVFQDNIAKFVMNPRVPYEIYTPPEAPDYTQQENWLTWPDPDSEKLVDVFYVPGTAYASSDHWNAPLDNRETRSTLQQVLLPNEAGPFAQTSNIYAPYYRQATLFSFFTQKHQGRAARKTAYADIKKAFEYFLAQSDPARPLILAGYDQGGLHVQGLLIDFFQNDEDLHRRLVAAYIIDQSTPLDLFNYTLTETLPCKYPTDVRCVVSWNALEARHKDEIWRKSNRLLVWNSNGTLESVEKRPLLCTNPLDWRLTADVVEKDKHRGAASAGGIGFGEQPAIIENAVSVQCLEGVAIVTQPRQSWLQRPHGFGKQWQSLDYNLFFEDIRVNAEERVIALASLLEQENRIAPPIIDTVEIGEAPIKKIPN
ncbi:DUF3089 domain-containing protein [Parvularcula sp. IMCC14364]|uniref:DUF3089 domain-containing protein n=1 Tax=Parvularcula sp. IMCC14364 TaxID=3067902 RepID=UPI002740DE00|nr:DUF3089 domain-containing protein [Parvularcula sp. IMCC14364]